MIDWSSGNYCLYYIWDSHLLIEENLLYQLAAPVLKSLKFVKTYFSGSNQHKSCVSFILWYDTAKCVEIVYIFSRIYIVHRHILTHMPFVNGERYTPELYIRGSKMFRREIDMPFHFRCEFCILFLTGNWGGGWSSWGWVLDFSAAVDLTWLRRQSPWN